MRYQEVFAEEQRKLPRSASRTERIAATQRASARWRAMKRNPVHKDWKEDAVLIGVILGAAFIGYQWFLNQNQAAPVPTTYQPPHTGL